MVLTYILIGVIGVLLEFAIAIPVGFWLCDIMDEYGF